MEQVAASTHQGVEQQLMMRHYDLSPQILCRVMNVVLSAEPESDEVFAQLALLPEPETSDSSSDKEQLPPPPKRSVRIFTKILTASDTSTHGGFSVLRKHAEDCLPPLDMTQDPPTQDLVAKDLHGHEWKFRHTYRGHPRRHLLTTGWSAFVSQKRLVAGDAVIFLRGESGELRVGIRRAKRQHTSQPSSVLTSHSMHMGVVATAWHAVMTRTMFSVYFKPRVSPSSFIVAYEKIKAMPGNLSVGKRFKMKFETEDASERSFSGTITGIDDVDPSSWPNSKWRSLKVNWDEITINDRQDRLSPWEIELCVSSPTVNPPPGTRSKRFRPSTVSELPVLGKANLESTLSSKLPRVLQGQELGNFGPASVVGDELTKSQLWGANVISPESWTPRANMFRGMAQERKANLSIEISTQNMETHPQQQLRRSSNQQEVGGSLQISNSRIGGFYSPFSSSESELKLSATSPQMFVSNNQMQAPAWQASPHAPSPSNNIPSAWLGQQPLQYVSLPPFSPWESPKQDKGATLPVSEKNCVPVSEKSCKIFGVSLTDNAAPATGVKSIKSGSSDVKEEHALEATEQPHNFEKDAELPQVPKPGKSDACSELEKPEKASKEVQSRSQSNPAGVRSCTKVIKKGSMGRGVDLSKFDNYEKLIEELEGMFHIEGELRNPEKGWQVAYSDDEGDKMLVGDDPWTEFCSMVRKVYIFSPEEVKSGGLPRMQGSAGDEPSGRDVSKILDNKDTSLAGLPG